MKTTENSSRTASGMDRSDLEDLCLGDKVRLVNPSLFLTGSSDIYRVTTISHGHVDIESPDGDTLTVEPGDIRYA